ncbi:MAG TPA: hypothetical protein VGF25_19720 [Thermoleophilaceae bacterium]
MADEERPTDEQLAAINPRFPELRAKYEALERTGGPAPVRVGAVDGRRLAPAEAKAAIAWGLKHHPGEFNPAANQKVYEEAYPPGSDRPSDAELATMDPRFPEMRASYEAEHPEADDEDETALEPRAALPHDLEYHPQIDALERWMGAEAEAPAQVRFWLNEGVKLLGRGRPDPAEVPKALEARWGSQWKSKLATAQALVARWPPAVIAFLEETGLGDHPTFISQVVRQADSRGH